MMKLEAIIFDVDGTLVDTDELHRRAFNQAFVEFDLGWDWKPDAYVDLLRISGGADRIRSYIDGLDIPDVQRVVLHRLVPGLHREKSRIYGELVAGNMVKPRPGIARLIAEASAAGLKIGLAATSSSKNLQPLIQAALGRGLASKIDVAVSADLVQRRKPAPDLYELVRSMLGVPSEHCVAFEDSANGVHAARAAGIITVAVPCRWTRAQDFSRANLVLSSLGEPDQPLSEGEASPIGGASQVGVKQVAELLERFSRPGNLRCTAG